ncbi:hypothetical protein MSAN_02060700 [Mycena sanguinolenta]|uniref:DUF6535 domain-containing protein n=1 Tax=Mycena sanguinolenta TaxID=230812 RepID=A0A8H6XJH4_9AGAR|nr:hypothetical protein MSAN_02060700 [Mycena sanguinolenta]
MPSVDQTTPSLQDQTDREELAGAKLWTFYVSQAERYDKALVEGWRSDMEGLLIFAGLFSASLTAFLIESYKTLSPDRGAITIALLAQISNQLHGGSNVPSLDVIPLMNVGPTSAALVCNTLWFLSLGLSLLCALMATLVEQWARHFIHSSEIKQSPVTRARIFAYLYYGVERFGMYALVQFIPLLLHISLLLFFAGLIAFLRPINAVVAMLAAAMLASISVTYLYFTVLPMFSSDSPFRTPLSNITWEFFRQLQAILLSVGRWLWNGEDAIPFSPLISGHNSIPTMFDVMLHDATVKSEGRARRDGRAMVWALMSLTDDDELEPFLEALPELVWGPNGRRHGYDNMISMLLESDLRLIPRIEALLRDSDNGLLAPEVQLRRRICCVKALWALACFSVSEAPVRQSFPTFDHTVLASQMTSTSTSVTQFNLLPYLTSAYAMVRCSDFCSLLTFIRAVLKNGKMSPIHRRQIQMRAAHLSFSTYSSGLEQLIETDWTHASFSAQQALDASISCTDLAYDILADYWRSSARVEQKSYQFEATSFLIQQVAPRPSTVAAMQLRDTFTALVDDNNQLIGRHQAFHPLDISLAAILRILQGNPDCLVDMKFLRLFLWYMDNRFRTQEVWARIFHSCDATFIGSLLTKCLVVFEAHQKDAVLDVIWFCVYWRLKFAIFDDATIMAIRATMQTFLTSCTLTAVKAEMLRRASGVPPARHPTLSQRHEEDLCTILLEFLDSCEKFPPNNPREHRMAADTFQLLTFYLPLTTTFSASFQRRFAKAFSNILDNGSPDLRRWVVSWLGWGGGSPRIQDFNDQHARATILEASRTSRRSQTLGELEQPGGITINLDALIAELSSETFNPASDAPMKPGCTNDSDVGTDDT